MVLLWIISDCIFVRINLNAYSDNLSHFSFKVGHYIIFFSCLWTTFPLTKVGMPIFEWAVPRPFVHLRVEIMVLLSMISDWIFVRINLNGYSDRLSHFCLKVGHYIIFFSCLWTTFPLTKVGMLIFEWAVQRPLLVHLRVEIMVLLSMISDCIFVRINLNAYSDSLSHFCFKVQHYIFCFSSLWTTFPLRKVGPPIFEWAVPRPFGHLRVEVMVLFQWSQIGYL